MNNNALQVDEIKTDLEIANSKISDLIISLSWFIEDNYDSLELGNMDECMRHGFAYAEQRIKITQLCALMEAYRNEINRIINKIDVLHHDMEKSASDSLTTEEADK